MIGDFPGKGSEVRANPARHLRCHFNKPEATVLIGYKGVARNSSKIDAKRGERNPNCRHSCSIRPLERSRPASARVTRKPFPAPNSDRLGELRQKPRLRGLTFTAS